MPGSLRPQEPIRGASKERANFGCGLSGAEYGFVRVFGVHFGDSVPLHLKDAAIFFDLLRPVLATMQDSSLATQIIADLRKRLLDLRNNNKLLAYKHSDRAKTHVRVVDKHPDFLHQCLTSAGSLTFRSLPDPDIELPDEKDDLFLRELENERRFHRDWIALGTEEVEISSNKAMKLDRQIRNRVRERLGRPVASRGKIWSLADIAQLNGIEASYDLPLPNGKTEGKHEDDGIQTMLLPEQMQAKLAGVVDHARTAQQEMGLNLLHMAIGFLEWYESATSDKPMLAPLLLYPVELERKAQRSKGQYSYVLSGTEESPVINITLRERLANDFDLILPELDEQDTAESYMARMAEVVKTYPRWRVRRFATLGLFSFSRIAMYNDLDPKNWGSNEGLAGTGVLGELFRVREGGDREPAQYDLEDEGVEGEVPLLIRDADSSQHQALIDVMRGRNLVIKGPPGTGKSQTIANMIAACLAKGKTVLFVAEKAAAIEVVRKRLDEAKLGDFCLDIHSTKVKKAEILSSLNRRLEVVPSSRRPSIEASLAHLQLHRRRLSSHAGAINSGCGELASRYRS